MTTLYSLTERASRARSHHPKVRYSFATNRSGFALRVNWGGTKSFIVEGRVNGRVRRITLGRYPAMSVAKARIAALKMKGEIQDGIDPTVAEAEAEEARKRAEAEAITFKMLVDRYIEHAKSHSKKTAPGRAGLGALHPEGLEYPPALRHQPR